jgi:hypothetical protein
MVASLKRVYENLWTLQKTPLTATKAHNRAHVTPLQHLAHNGYYCVGDFDVSALQKREKGVFLQKQCFIPESSIT